MWTQTWKADPAVRRLADRHYSRETIGAVGFAPPGQTIVLRLTHEGQEAAWISSWQQYAKHAWRGAWVCTLFRNETTLRSSDLIREALAVTLTLWGYGYGEQLPPKQGMITFVDPRKVQSNVPGWCFRRAAFKRVGTTSRGLLVLQCPPEKFPAKAMAPRSPQLRLWEDAHPTKCPCGCENVRQ